MYYQHYTLLLTATGGYLMVLARIMQTQYFSFLPQNFSNDLTLLIVGGVCAFLLAYLFTFGVIAFCRKMNWMDQPEARRMHKKPVPRLGGVGIFLAFVVASLLFYAFFYPHDTKVLRDEFVRYWLLLVAAAFIVLVHAVDDVKGLKPLTKLIAQTIAVIIILGPFLDMRFHGIFLFGFSNPFGASIHHAGLPWYREPILTLFISQPVITWAAIPAILFTWFWIAGMMNTVNFIDGLDGLATGVVGITGVFITIISWTLGQNSIALLAGIFTGAVLGFLPHNWNPAKIFMGDSGAQFLGLGLAVLSIMGGAKIALALMVLGIPILDVAIVAINRIRRGQSFAHYDTKHLHHRLLATGLSVKQISYVFYGLTILFGILALNMRHIYKLLGIGLVGLTMVALIIWIDYRQRQRGVPIKLDGPEPTPTGGALEDRELPSPNETEQETHAEYESEMAEEATEVTSPPPESTVALSHAHLPL